MPSVTQTRADFARIRVMHACAALTEPAWAAQTAKRRRISVHSFLRTGVYRRGGRRPGSTSVAGSRRLGTLDDGLLVRRPNR